MSYFVWLWMVFSSFPYIGDFLVWLMNILSLSVAFLLCFFVKCTPPHDQGVDIAIYGGTAAGFTAAIQAAELGYNVLLIEPSGHVGGMMVEGLGGSDIDNHGDFQNSVVVSGLALEFYRRIAHSYGRLDYLEKVVSEQTKDADVWRFESKVAEKVIGDWLASYPNIQVLTHARLSETEEAVRKDGADITEILLENGELIRAKVFIDATIEGDLLAKAGVSYTVGRESNKMYGERLNGIREENTYRQFEVKVNPYKDPSDTTSGLIYTIQDEEFGVPGEGDDRLQAYCFRMCLTQNKANQLPFTKPEGYERDHYEIYLRYLKAGGKLYTPSARLPNGKTDLGAWHDLSHNLYGMNRGYPDASYEERKKILALHRQFTQGLFYFLANDPEVGELDPGLQLEWSSWGLAKDEFTDNGGWPRNFYVRDGRRMVSDYVITEHHVRREGFSDVIDPVALAYWPPDVHHVRRIVKDGFAYNEGFVFGGNEWRPLPLSFRSLVPQKEECTNLITPTCLSSSHIAYGAIRIEWTFMVLGQAAAIMADVAIKKQVPFQQLEYADLLPLLENEKIIVRID